MSPGASSVRSDCSCNQPYWSHHHHHHCERYTRRLPPPYTYSYREPAIIREPVIIREPGDNLDSISVYRHPTTTTQTIYLQPHDHTARVGSPGHRLYNLDLPFEHPDYMYSGRENRLGELPVSAPHMRSLPAVYCAHCDRALRGDGSCGCDVLSLYHSPPSSPPPTLLPRSYHCCYLPHGSFRILELPRT